MIWLSREKCRKEEPIEKVNSVTKSWYRCVILVD